MGLVGKGQSLRWQKSLSPQNPRRDVNPFTVVSPARAFGFLAKDLINYFSELAFGRWLGCFRTGDLCFQVEHEGLHPLAAGLKFLDEDFQFPDFFS